MSPLQNLVLKSLLDLLVALAWAWWDRLGALHDERRAAVEQKRPVLRLETRRVLRLPPRRFEGFPVVVVAVLVSEPGMEHRVRRALGGRATLRFASTWAELQQVVAYMAPSAIVADPLPTGVEIPNNTSRYSQTSGACPWFSTPP